VTPSTPVRLGTRGSILATTQSRGVADGIHAATGRRIELVEIRTLGDQVQDRPIGGVGGQGVFTRALDEALLEGEIDLAVHSLKDLPTRLTEGLVLAAVPEREDARDVLVGPEGRPTTLDTLPQGAVVGTGSLRRQALARAFRADIEVKGIRGNLDTRLRMVDEGRYDAVILAAAGLLRLGWTDRIHEHLDPGAWLPAPGQGALAVVARTDDPDAQALAKPLDHLPSRAATTAERALMHALEAGCQLPVGALGIPFGGGMRLRGIVASLDGRRVVRADRTGAQDDPEALGLRLAERLRTMGAGDILAEVRPGTDRPRPPASPRDTA
jgi:hydroxymethylbilane synthase